MELIERNSYLNKIKPFIEKPIVKIITGMRRVGKSKLFELLQNHIKKTAKNSEILFINLESLEYSFNNYRELYKYIGNNFSNKKTRKFLFLDEIQLIDNWEKVVNSLFSENIADIYITGSNAYLFSKELATLLTGRYIEIEIFPLSFSEFLKFRQVANSEMKIETEKEFEIFLKYGGLPAIHNFEMEDEIIFDYLYNIFNTIILKDVVTRNNIRDTSNLISITKYIFDNCGNITSGKAISDYFKSQKIKISVDTILNYIEYLQKANLIKSVERYDLRGKKYLENLAKYYLGDIGLRNGLIGYKSKDISGLLENIVFLELLKRGYKVSIGKLYGNEIDFIAENSKKRIYIQVSYLLRSEKTINREFKSLESIKDNYPKYLLTLDKFQKIERNGIIHKNLINFLLNE
jgi:uncharacterized protein